MGYSSSGYAEGKLTLREVDGLAQGHTAGKWPGWDFNPSSPASKSQILFVRLMLRPQDRGLRSLRPQIDHCGALGMTERPGQGPPFSGWLGGCCCGPSRG